MSLPHFELPRGLRVRRVLVLASSSSDAGDGAASWRPLCERAGAGRLAPPPAPCDARVLHAVARELQNTRFSLRRELSCSFGNCMDRAFEIALYLARQALGVLPPDEIPKLQLGLGELISNAIEHGNLAITGEMKTRAVKDFGDYFSMLRTRQRDPRFRRRRVWVRSRITPACCEWIIEDEGDGFNWQKIPCDLNDGSLMMCHGRGIILSRIQLDEVSYQGTGNRVYAKKFVASVLHAGEAK